MAAKSFFQFFIVLFTLSSCATSLKKQPDESELFLRSFSAWDIPKNQNLLMPGNEIIVTGSEDPQINGIFRVSPLGILRLGYGVKLSAAGKTVEKVAKEAMLQYSEFSLDAGMQVRYKSKNAFIEITGAVRKPGFKVIRSTRTIDEIISLSGGYNYPDSLPCNITSITIEQLNIRNRFPVTDQNGSCRIMHSNLLPQKWFGGEKIEVSSKPEKAENIPDKFFPHEFHRLSTYIRK